MHLKYLTPFVAVVVILAICRGANGQAKFFQLVDLSCQKSFGYQHKHASKQAAIWFEGRCKEDYHTEKFCQYVCVMVRDDVMLSVHHWQYLWVQCDKGQEVELDGGQKLACQDKADLTQIAGKLSQRFWVYGMPDPKESKALAEKILTNCAEHFKGELFEELGEDDFSKDVCVKLRPQLEPYVNCVVDHWKCKV